MYGREGKGQKKKAPVKGNRSDHGEEDKKVSQQESGRRTSGMRQSIE